MHSVLLLISLLFRRLAEHLVSCFSDANCHRINIENGLDVSTRNSQRLLKRVSVINVTVHGFCYQVIAGKNRHKVMQVTVK